MKGGDPFHFMRGFMKDVLSFLKKGLIFFEKENKKNIDNVQKTLERINNKKYETTKVIENNPIPNYNEYKDKIEKLEKQLKDAGKK